MVWTVLTVVNQLEFAALFVLCFLVGMRMRTKLSLVLYMLLVEVVAVYLVVFPVYCVSGRPSRPRAMSARSMRRARVRCSRPRDRHSWPRWRVRRRRVARRSRFAWWRGWGGPVWGSRRDYCSIKLYYTAC